jgi:HTH-type transcriptional regulator, sugar sensing transcriptional regulator
MLVIEDLTNIGLTKNEAEVYLILLKLREAKAYDISKHTTISRSHVYDSLNNLIYKGIINYITKDKKRIYAITDPENLIKCLEEREENILKQKEALKTKIQTIKESPKMTTSKTEVYEGVEGVKYILNDIINDGINKRYNEILVMNSFSEQEFTKTVPEYVWQKFWNLRNKHKISSRQLYAEGKKVTKSPNLNVRILPKSYFNDNVIQSIYGNKIIFMILTSIPMVIKIDSEETANLFRKQFEILWKSSKR